MAVSTSKTKNSVVKLQSVSWSFASDFVPLLHDSVDSKPPTPKGTKECKNQLSESDIEFLVTLYSSVYYEKDGVVVRKLCRCEISTGVVVNKIVRRLIRQFNKKNKLSLTSGRVFVCGGYKDDHPINMTELDQITQGNRILNSVCDVSGTVLLIVDTIGYFYKRMPSTQKKNCEPWKFDKE